MPTIASGLPKFYGKILPSFFEAQVPEETKANCNNCAMCPSKAEASAKGATYFKPSTKCCTYEPRLPNFLVGGLLADASPAFAEGRRRIQERLARQHGVTPQWLKPRTMHAVLYDNARQFFGRTEAMLCSYYERGPGHCTIWAYREAICSTFFCKHVAGADGRHFWMSLKGYLRGVERQLSQYALLRLLPEALTDADLEDDGDRRLTQNELDDLPPDDELYAKLWGGWRGRESEFYQRCFAEVDALDQTTFEHLTGVETLVGLERLKRAHRTAIQPELPERLCLSSSLKVFDLPEAAVAVSAYSEYDPLRLPREVFLLLREFDGQATTNTVRTRLAEEKGCEFEDDLLVLLMQYRILIPAP